MSDQEKAGKERSCLRIDEERPHIPRLYSHVGGVAFHEAVGI
jgi:hypothetical protein